MAITEEDKEKKTYSEDFNLETTRDRIIRDIEEQKRKVEDAISKSKENFNKMEGDVKHRLELILKDIKNVEKNLDEFKRDYKDDYRNRVNIRTMIWWIIATLLIGLMGGGFLRDKILELFINS